jgi:hypothetical protein
MDEIFEEQSEEKGALEESFLHKAIENFSSAYQGFLTRN